MTNLITHLLANMLVLNPDGTLTNVAPAFQQYAYHLAFTNAQSVASSWGLDQNLISTSSVTSFHVTASPDEFHASIIFADRYAFQLHADAVLLSYMEFEDERYDFEWLHKGDQYSPYGWFGPSGTQESAERNFDLHSGRPHTQYEPSRLPRLRSARRLAQAALAALPKMSRKTFHINRGAERAWRFAFATGDAQTNTYANVIRIRLRQSTGYLEKIDPSHSHGQGDRPGFSVLPFYDFGWAGDRKERLGGCFLHISGVTGAVAYFNFVFLDPDFWMPKNYLQLLGIPANSLFVQPVPGRKQPAYMLYDKDP
ncbi:MAG: hypothetical protein C5B50_14935 [Verrucomicrobia bacterium]|nr:MAG: hypothetical protein C5B50_14935 [Verrucomicrobiota bacterium]